MAGNATFGLGGTKGQGLEALKQALQKRIVKKAVTKTVQPVAKAVKAACPVRDAKDVKGGTLKKSIGYRVGANKQTGKVSAAVGARKGFKREIGKGKDGSPVYADPAKYMHLVEYGTYRSRALPFVRPAWQARRAQARATFVAVMQQEIRAEAAKALAKAKAGGK
jgi:HK97 gp10 family phage protein